jgi:hypothetical protein
MQSQRVVKILVLVAVLTVVLSFVAMQFGRRYIIEYSGKYFIAPTKAQEKWGMQKLKPEEFKAATPGSPLRAAQAVAIVAAQLYVDGPMEKVKAELGPTDGFFLSEQFPVYEIQKATASDPEVWQLIFMPDADNRFVISVKIHKKCCYKPNPF